MALVEKNCPSHGSFHVYWVADCRCHSSAIDPNLRHSTDWMPFVSSCYSNRAVEHYLEPLQFHCCHLNYFYYCCCVSADFVLQSAVSVATSTDAIYWHKLPCFGQILGS